MQCTKCQSTIAEGAKFCPKCGTRAETPAVEIGGKRCPQCGTDNPANAKFCKKDGYRFVVPAQDLAEPGVTPAVPAPVRALVPEAVPTAPPPSPAGPQVVKPVDVPKVQAPPPKPMPPTADEVACPKCGTANALTAKFCKKDGYPLQSTTAVTPVSAMPLHSPVPKDISPENRPEVVSAVTPSAPPVVPLATPPKQPAVARPAVSAAPAGNVPIKPTAKPGKGLMIGAAVGVAILASAGGGYAYWAGYVGNRQGSVQNEINAELGSHGLSNIKVAVNHAWVASLAGTVLNQSDKDQAFGLVSGYKELKSIVNEVQIESNAADVEKSLRKSLAEAGLGALTADVDKEFIATLSGTLTSDKEKIKATTIAKSAAGVKAVVDQMVVVNMSEAPDTESVRRDFDDRMSHSLGAGSSRPYLSIEELYALHQSAGIDDPSTANTDVHNALIAAMRNTRVALNQQQIQQIIKTHSAAASPPQSLPPLPVASQSAPQRTADKVALERELNARLRANGVSGVTGRVNPDMSVTLSGTVQSEDERYRALAIGGALPGASGVRETIQITTPQVARLASPQAPIPAPTSQVAPQVPPQAAAIDPAKLEGDINRALRSRDINSVTAQVNDDMSLTLKGSASASEKERALQLARQVRGIRGIKDKIFVVE